MTIWESEKITSKHDELILELLNKENMYRLFPELKDHELRIESEVPIINKNGNIIKYWDLIVTDLTDIKKIYIEVKPYIETFGETLRQLNTYVYYEGIAKEQVYLYTPDVILKESFEGQGYKVLKHEGKLESESNGTNEIKMENRSVVNKMEDYFNVDERKIDKMVNWTDRIKMPDKGEQITIWLTTSPKYVENPKLPKGKAFISKARKLNENKKRFDEMGSDFIWVPTIFKTFASELKKKKMDRSETNMKNRIITIVGRDWASADKSMWKTNDVTGELISPKTYSLEIRSDLEDIYLKHKDGKSSTEVKYTNEF